jgi:hypothetical protein
LYVENGEYLSWFVTLSQNSRLKVFNLAFFIC